MLLLFENTLIHYIYIVFYTLISRAHPRPDLGNLAPTINHARTTSGRTTTATPSPRSEQLHTVSNHARTTSGRTPTATPSPTTQATFTP